LSSDNHFVGSEGIHPVAPACGVVQIALLRCS